MTFIVSWLVTTRQCQCTCVSPAWVRRNRGAMGFKSTPLPLRWMKCRSSVEDVIPSCFPHLARQWLHGPARPPINPPSKARDIRVRNRDLLLLGPVETHPSANTLDCPSDGCDTPKLCLSTMFVPLTTDIGCALAGQGVKEDLQGISLLGKSVKPRSPLGWARHPTVSFVLFWIILCHVIRCGIIF